MAERQSRRERREALIARSAVLRERLAPQLDRADSWIIKGLQVRDAATWAKQHQSALQQAAGALALLMLVLRPRRAWKLGKLGWRLWRAWRRLKLRLDEQLGGSTPGLGAGKNPSGLRQGEPANAVSGLSVVISLISYWLQSRQR